MPQAETSLKAVILVGGPGTRLQPLTRDVPKSMVPVLNRPFLEYTLAYLGRYGVKDIVLTLSYLPEVIRAHFGDGRHWGVRLAYCIEDEPLGTAGAVKNAESHLDGTFLVLNGDVFNDLDIGAMLAFHRERQALATIALTEVADPGAFGVVVTAPDGSLSRFVEKPPPGQAPSNLINAGTYLLEPEALAHVPGGCYHMFEQGLFPRLIALGRAVYGYPFGGYWLDMGSPAKYFSLNRDLLRGKVSSPLLAGDAREVICDWDVGIHPSAVIEGPAVIGAGCRIGAGARIRGPVAIGRDCVIEESAAIEDAVLWEGVSLGRGARLHHCVLAGHVSIGAGESLENYVITAEEKERL